MKFAWIDIRAVDAQRREAVVDAAVHAGLGGVLDHRLETLATLPPTVTKVLLPGPGEVPPAEAAGVCDVVLTRVATFTELDKLKLVAGEVDAHAGAFVEVVDDLTLRVACAAVQALEHTVVRFRDPTKIPLEIVIAAADRAPGLLVCEADGIEEARIVLDVLEKGSDGLLVAPRDANDVFDVDKLLRAATPDLALTTLTVRSVEHNGLGDRICVDTCTHFREDEGILVGSFAHGFVLCVSETHPLPYMPTRPFRVNAGALHSYVFGADNRTNYLSELKAGSTVLGVTADGRTRRIVVGRVKLESRPLLTVHATAPDGTEVALTLQDDWHVRVLGPGAAVLNSTELEPGDQLLGYLATDKRHVGWPVGEFCIEK
ncbi:3-amino-4-hydroxybenzoic acid synthase [Saccharothrix tamanrassetensis]|uniref:3-amino-4-hydroxybenzoic acid synthase n=1 Tax=Saccharothrix tamanrassetensis TaxID=1051531 RepID=A0A841CMM4_9PSEU|nr:3-dehydroquinate synthase II [Saccharothrix tamanrassetensis]MBB5959722.1 3-amino-4-hydroxybenzoic acid synthase [Saccharothrix tamanrassetensis]